MVLIDLVKGAGRWFLDNLRGFWNWAKKHPLLASALIAGILFMAFFPYVLVALPAVPYIGPAIWFIAAQAPVLWSIPIVWCLTVATVVMQTAVVLLLVEGFKKIFASNVGQSVLRKLANPFGSQDSVEDEALDHNNNLSSTLEANSQANSDAAQNQESTDNLLDQPEYEFDPEFPPKPAFQTQNPNEGPSSDEIVTRTPPSSPALFDQPERGPSPVANPQGFKADSSVAGSRNAFHRRSPSTLSVSSQNSTNNLEVRPGS